MESNYLVSCELWEFGGADCRLLLFFFADHTWLTHLSHWMVVISALPGGIDNRVCKDCVTAKSHLFCTIHWFFPSRAQMRGTLY